MKDAGVREDDPELRKMHHLLSQLNQQQQMMKAQKEQQARQAMQRQAQAQALSQQTAQNGSLASNGVNGNHVIRYRFFKFNTDNRRRYSR